MGSVVSLKEKRLLREFPLQFKTCLTLVENAAVYLDGPGRSAAKSMNGNLARRYAVLSMELTTRLLDAASIALTVKSLQEQAISIDDALRKLSRIKRSSTGSESLDELPSLFVELVNKSIDIRKRMEDYRETVTARYA